VSQTKCETHVQDVALKNAEMRDPSTTHGTVITHFCVARRQGAKKCMRQEYTVREKTENFKIKIYDLY